MWSVEPVRSSEQILAVARLAREIWSQHFPGIIEQAQIDYMLELMYSPAVVTAEIEDGIRYDLLRHEGVGVGYCSYGSQHSETQLHKLYVLASNREAGGGRTLLARAVCHARERGHQAVVLRVNRNNRLALAVYRKMGFRIRAESTLDIGGGFVMDDYVLQWELPLPGEVG